MWLTYRLRIEIRLKKVRYSLPTALRAGLKVGLPWSAMLVAIIPVLGMSWFFDTENWAAGVWDSWAASRTDHWRVAITNQTTMTGTTHWKGLLQLSMSLLRQKKPCMNV